jgi:plastocyanin
MPRRHNVVMLMTACALLGCGGGGTDPGGDEIVMAKASASGDGQSAPFGTVLAQPLRVILTRGGAPVAGRTVTWQAQAGIQVNPVTMVSGNDGVASTVVTLPPFGAIRTITATSVSAIGSPQSFTVTATGAGTLVNVQVVNNEFLPSTFNLKAGGMVTFTWAAGSGPHNVTPVAPNLIPVSDNPAPPGTHTGVYSFDTIFPAAGTFRFYCEVHGGIDSGMHGTITVIP